MLENPPTYARVLTSMVVVLRPVSRRMCHSNQARYRRDLACTLYHHNHVSPVAQIYWVKNTPEPASRLNAQLVHSVPR